MRIIFITPSIKTGGGNRVFIELANQLCDQNEVTVVYPNNSSDVNTFYNKKNVRFIKVGKLATSKLGKLCNILHCIRYLNSLDSASKLIFTDPIFCLLLLFVRHKERVYRFVQADDYRIYDDGYILGRGLLLKIYKRLCLRSYQQKIQFIFNSQFVYNNFCIDSQRTNVVFNKVYPAINHTMFRQVEGNSSSSGCSLCLVARKHPWKGLSTFVDVFQNLPQVIKGKISQVTLVSHDDLSEFDTCGMIVVKPACDEDIARVYQNADIFISTSWWEGFGLPPLEAMACGCAVICSDSGGVNEYVKPGKNCLIFQPKDEDELENALIRLIDDKTLRESLSKQGVKTAKNFTWEESAKQFIEIIS